MNSSDGFRVTQSIPPPSSGLYGGMDSDAPDELLPPSGAVDLENIRTGAGVWETRYGSTLYQDPPGSGVFQLLSSITDANSNRWLFCVQGGVAYELDLDHAGAGPYVWTAVTVSGSPSLSATNRCTSAPVGYNLYVSDRVGPLRVYDPALHTLAPVTQPAKPVAAPGVIARSYGILETWPGAATFGWSPSNAARFSMAASSNYQAPIPGTVIQIEIKDAAAPGDTISDNVASEGLYSRTIAFYVNGSVRTNLMTFSAGFSAPGEAVEPIAPPRIGEWYIWFLRLGLMDVGNFKQFRCVHSPTATRYLRVSPMILPGKLQGRYRYRISYYNPTTGAESTLSAASLTADCSAVGVNYVNDTQAALRKCVGLTWATSGVAGRKVRIYRSGGIPELTTDEQGREIWVYLGQVDDLQTTVANGSPASAGASTVVVTSAAGLAVGNWICIDRTGNADFRRITGIATNTLTLDEPLANAHSYPALVQLAFLDNQGNEDVSLTRQIHVERDDPPAGVRHLAISPGGRMLIFGWTASRGGVAVSSRATPEHSRDYEVFPDGVDPLTRKDLQQGWRFDITGVAGTETVMWGGFFNRVATVLTRSGLYQFPAQSQVQWSPSTVTDPISRMGCIAGDATVVLNGYLYWVTDGPRVVRWDGRGAPEVVSQGRINRILEAAPVGYWGSWWANAHGKRDGSYYQLWIVPAGQTETNEGLQLNTDTGVWERFTIYNAGGARRTFSCGHVPERGADTRQNYMAVNSGGIIRLDDPTATTDIGVAIRIRAVTKRLDLGSASQIQEFRVLVDPVADDVTFGVTTSGTEYGVVSHSYVRDLDVRTDGEIRQRVHRDSKGRRAQFSITGSVSHRPIFRMAEWAHFRIQARATSRDAGAGN